jgi:hypothetical protein
MALARQSELDQSVNSLADPQANPAENVDIEVQTLA